MTRSWTFSAIGCALTGWACAHGPVGWRGDGTGQYPSANPHTHWSTTLVGGTLVVKLADLYYHGYTHLWCLGSAAAK